MGGKKSTEAGFESKSIQQSTEGVTPVPTEGVIPAGQSEPDIPPSLSKPTSPPSLSKPTSPPEPEQVILPSLPETEDWRLNREWCLNQALDIVKSLKFEVKDVPAFLESVYRKIIELANDARGRKNA